MASANSGPGGDQIHLLARLGPGDAIRDEVVAYPMALGGIRAVAWWGSSGFAAGGASGLAIGTSAPSD